jgi:hypothetical protein
VTHEFAIGDEVEFAPIRDWTGTFTRGTIVGLLAGCRYVVKLDAVIGDYYEVEFEEDQLVLADGES